MPHVTKSQNLHAANGTSHLAPCASWPGSRPHPARHLHPPLLPPGRPPEPHWLWAPQCLQGSQPAQVSDQHLQDCTCTRRAAGMAHGRPGAAAFWGRNLNPRIVCGAPFSTGGCMPAAASAALKSDASVTSSGIAAWRQSSPSAQVLDDLYTKPAFTRHRLQPPPNSCAAELLVLCSAFVPPHHADLQKCRE